MASRWERMALPDLSKDKPDIYYDDLGIRHVDDRYMRYRQETMQKIRKVVRMWDKGLIIMSEAIRMIVSDAFAIGSGFTDDDCFKLVESLKGVYENEVKAN